MKKRNLLLAALLLILVAPSFAAKVDTLLVNSPSMNKDVQVVVVTPVSYTHLTLPTNSRV